MRLEKSFYQRNEVTKVAKDLLGKILVTDINGKLCSGMIVETEAYSHREKGCHAYQNRMTVRNKVMFSEGGFAYVYLCYGIHHLFNVVTNKEGIGDAVLIRAIEPLDGLANMMERMNAIHQARISSGPGKLSKALGINRSHNGISLLDGRIWIEDRGLKIARKDILATQRVGIDYAGEDAKLPWRFLLKGNIWISRN